MQSTPVSMLLTLGKGEDVSGYVNSRILQNTNSAIAIYTRKKVVARKDLGVIISFNMP